MNRIYTTDNISANQRAWYRQKFNPRKCQYCDAPIVFLKDITWRYVVCEAVKKIVNPGEGDTSILQEDGMISREGRRIGWPVHHCPKHPNVQAYNAAVRSR